MDKDKTKRTLRRPVKKSEGTFLYKTDDGGPLIQKVQYRPPEMVKVDSNFGPVIFCCILCGRTNKQTTVCRYCMKCIDCSPVSSHVGCWVDTRVKVHHVDVDELDVTNKTEFKRYIFVDISFGSDFIPNQNQMDELIRDMLGSVVLWRRSNMP